MLPTPNTTAASAAKSQRDVGIDLAKAAGIILVVVAHVVGENTGVAWKLAYQFIFLFHMPLFFLISGIFSKQINRFELISKRISSLVIPYFSYLVLIFFLDAFVALCSGRAPSVASFKGVAGLALGGTFAVGKYGVFWFVSCLFIVTIIANEIRTKGKRRVIAILLIAFGFSSAISLAPAIPSPLGILSVPAALIAYHTGSMYVQLRSMSLNLKLILCCGLIFGVAIALFSGWSFEFDMKRHIFGAPIVGIALSIGLSFVFLSLCEAIKSYDCALRFSIMGHFTLPIMMLHQFVHFTLREHGFTNIILIIGAALLIPLAFGAFCSQSKLLRRAFLGH